MSRQYPLESSMWQPHGHQKCRYSSIFRSVQFTKFLEIPSYKFYWLVCRPNPPNWLKNLTLEAVDRPSTRPMIKQADRTRNYKYRLEIVVAMSQADKNYNYITTNLHRKKTELISFHRPWHSHQLHTIISGLWRSVV